jgi:hypothetical protein
VVVGEDADDLGPALDFAVQAHEIWTSEPDRFILDPIDQMRGLNV